MERKKSFLFLLKIELRVYGKSGKQQNKNETEIPATYIRERIMKSGELRV